MRRLTFLLRPQWVALFIVVAAFAYLCFTVLAPWQLGKNTKTSRENSQISHSLQADPVPVTTVLPHQDSVAPDAQWQRVTATGHYLPKSEVLVRLRVVDGEPAFEVLTPFAVDGGPVVLVNRGFITPVDGNKVPEFAPAPTDRVTVTARVRDAEARLPGKEPFRGDDGAQQVYSINPDQIASLTGVALTGSYLQLVANQPGGLGELSLPHLDAGPFLSYGIQWIAFGIVAPLGVGYFVYAEIQQRRRERAVAQAAAKEPPRELTGEEKIADRYGKRR